MSYGYDSYIAFSKSEIELGDVAADLLNRLNDERTLEVMVQTNLLLARELTLSPRKIVQ